MRKIAFLLTLAFALTTQAQDAQIANIRKLYAEVKENMDYRKAAEIPPNETVVTSNYMAPGAGPIKDITHYFYDCDYDEEIATYIYTPTFITRKHNVGAIEYYEELLFDNGSLVFYFCKQGANETRYYWGPNGFLHEVIKGEREMDEVFASRLAGDLKSAFDKLMNRDY